MLNRKFIKPGKRARFELTLSMLALFSAVLLLNPAPSPAGEWHLEKKGFCGDCHSSHPGKWGMGISRLESKKTLLCLDCHSGARQRTSNVFKPGKAGGFFAGYQNISRRGHDLGISAMLPGSRGMIIFECTTCHDAHGNDNYRNLLPNPYNPNSPDVEVIAKERTGRKKYGKIRYFKGISAWCQTCHSDLYTEEPDKNIHHRVGITLIKLDLIKSEQEVPFTMNLPMDDPLENTKKNKPASYEDDTINCITCHYAHGSANPYALRFADNKTLGSTCKHCHIGGIEEPKPPATTK